MRRQQVAMNPNVLCKWRFSVQKQSATNKKNIQHGVANTHKTTRVNRVVKVVKGNWTYEALKEAMEILEGGTSTMRKESRNWGIYHCFFLEII